MCQLFVRVYSYIYIYIYNRQANSTIKFIFITKGKDAAFTVLICSLPFHTTNSTKNELINLLRQ